MEAAQKQNIFHFEDVDLKDINESVVGRKGLSLFELHNFDAPVSEFFVISTTVYEEFVKKVFTEKGKEFLENGNPEYKEVLHLFSKFDFENELKKELLTCYTRLSGFSDAWVAVRSSVAFPQGAEVSFSGVFNTKLNVRGFTNLITAIKEIYASLFTDSAVMYATREGIELADVKIAVVVQKMVHAEVSGVAFTLDPVTLDMTKMSIEAVYGLGEVISNGEVTPDTYHLEKKDLTIYEKHIAPQEWMKIRNLSDSKNGIEKITISPSWSHRQKLDDRHIYEVAKISLLIEEKYGLPVDIEWVIGGGKVSVLQAKKAMQNQNVLPHHIQYGGYGYVANSVKGVIEDILGKHEIREKVMTDATNHVLKEAEPSKLPPVFEKPRQKEMIAHEQVGVDAILTGIGASFGQIKGVAIVAKSPIVDIGKDNILVISEFERSLSDLIFKSGGVICEKGGATSDIAILCRELGIPAVVGIPTALEVLHTGDTLAIDGNTGAVFRLDEAKQEQVKIVKEIVEKLEKQEEEVKAKQSPAPTASDISIIALPKTATKVYVSKKKGIDITSEAVSSDGIGILDLDKVMIENGRHPVAFLSEGKYKEYSEKLLVDVLELVKRMDNKEVIVTIGMQKVRKFTELTKGGEFENKDLGADVWGATRYLENRKCLEVALRLIKRMRNIHHLRNVSLGIYGPGSGEVMKNIKKEISGKGLRRTTSFNIYAILENPSEIILADDILSADIDGIILDSGMIARYIFNLPKATSAVSYDLGSGSILKIIDTIVGSTKLAKRRLIVDCENNKDILRHCINKGVYAVITNEDFVVEAKRIVSDTEAKLILSIG
ncbi:PEP-utilizing enzyme [Candidatus Dojkabacteria bacterium]|jgi:pyruvate,water dikinase|nr:PEP-utilizing enzyme [Candidatus Dojkabacteria bacterium]